jgi:hypothetical protein
MILGILYCLSNSKQRAERFYELIASEMEETIDTTDPDFQEYFPIIGEISYVFILEIYNGEEMDQE